MTHDPMLAAAKQYRIDLAAFDNLPDNTSVDDPEGHARAEAKWWALYAADSLPEITSPAGAVMALRVSVEENAFCDSFSQRMAEAALAFLERHHCDGGAS